MNTNESVNYKKSMVVLLFFICWCNCVDRAYLLGKLLKYFMNDRIVPSVWAFGRRLSNFTNVARTKLIWVTSSWWISFLWGSSKTIAGKMRFWRKSIRHGSWFTESYKSFPQIMELTRSVNRLHMTLYTNWTLAPRLATQFVQETIVDYLGKNLDHLQRPRVVKMD